MELGQQISGSDPVGSIRLESVVEYGIRLLAELIEKNTGKNPLYTGYSNDTFTIRPYSYDAPDIDDEASGRYVEPNFEYGDFEVSWYKHLGRGAYQNKSISFDEAREMFVNCAGSI